MDYFNFCHSCLNPSVKSSAVSAEGYEVTNLILDGTNKKQAGFMVYHTINPPIDVTFSFMCRININHIIIWPQVGCQKSIGFQIFTNSGKSNIGQFNQEFVNVGTAFLQNEPGIIFHHQYNPPNNCDFLRRKLSVRQNSLSGVQEVQIRIMKTQQSSVPAILKVEVWGLPSVSCPREMRMKVLDLWARKDKLYKVEPKIPEYKSEESVLRSTATALVNSNFEIPEDFLDPITCEVMVLPFVLPSGKIVDHTTLDKHEKHEANWGRQPSDPFTGKLYTSTSRPVPAIALKSRIDKFLIDHADVDELKKLPRTVGRRLNSSTLCKKIGNEVMTKVHEKDVMKGNETKAGKKIAVNNNGNGDQMTFNQLKRKSEQTEIRCKKIKSENIGSSNVELKPSCSDPKFVPPFSGGSLKQSHEDLLNDCLNVALKSALSHLPSFTNFTQTDQEEKKCCQCNEKEVLYILSCQHLLCRTCLTKKMSNKDSKCSCDLSIKSSEIKRYFL